MVKFTDWLSNRHSIKFENLRRFNIALSLREITLYSDDSSFGKLHFFLSSYRKRIILCSNQLNKALAFACVHEKFRRMSVFEILDRKWNAFCAFSLHWVTHLIRTLFQLHTSSVQASAQVLNGQSDGGHPAIVAIHWACTPSICCWWTNGSERHCAES